MGFNQLICSSINLFNQLICFWTAKDTINKAKGQSTKWDKIYAKDTIYIKYVKITYTTQQKLSD